MQAWRREPCEKVTRSCANSGRGAGRRADAAPRVPRPRLGREGSVEGRRAPRGAAGTPPAAGRPGGPRQDCQDPQWRCGDLSERLDQRSARCHACGLGGAPDWGRLADPRGETQSQALPDRAGPGLNSFLAWPAFPERLTLCLPNYINLS